MEDFSQSRGDDDLFDDEIIPIESAPSPEKVTSQLQKVSIGGAQPLAQQPQSTIRSTPSQPPRGRGRGRDGQPGRGSAGSVTKPQRNGLGESRFAPKNTNIPTSMPDKKPEQISSKVTDPTSTAEASATPEPSTTQPAEPATTVETPADGTSTAATVSAVDTTQQQQRTPAVRGDRLATGGVRKPKLTEEELTAKLAAAKERSQNVAAAHARAQADAAHFEERERMAQQKRVKEDANRKVMEGEREKNRLRKMKAAGGREWDLEKREEDYAGGAAGGPRRRGPGPGEEQDLSMYEWNEDRSGGRGRGGRGRGGRGPRGGRGGGNTRGGYSNGPANQQGRPDISAETDFPALPAGQLVKLDTKAATVAPSVKRMDSESASTPPLAGSSWADQVEFSEAAKG